MNINLDPIKIAALVVAIGTISGAWVAIHSTYVTQGQLESSNIVERVSYHDIRIAEYDAVSKDKQDSTWSARKEAHVTRLQIFCDDLKVLEVPNRVCDKR